MGHKWQHQRQPRAENTPRSDPSQYGDDGAHGGRARMDPVHDPAGGPDERADLEPCADNPLLRAGKSWEAGTDGHLLGGEGIRQPL